MFKQTKKYIYYTGIILLLAGCTLDPVTETKSYVAVHYLHQSEYNQLLDDLTPVSGITRQDIDNALGNMGVSTSYQRSIYTSGGYVCYSCLWSDYSEYTYDWIYYIDVDIWVVNGQLDRDMCDYYSY